MTKFGFPGARGVKALACPFVSLTLLAVLAVAPLFVAPLFLAPVAQAAESTVVFEGAFRAGDLIWDQAEDGTYLPVLPDTRALEQPGLPRVPARHLMLLVPLDWNVTSAWVEALETHREKTPGNLGLTPALVASDGGTLDAPHMKSLAGVFPAAWSEFQGTHTWRGYRLLTVQVHPLQTGSDGLEFLDRYAVHVSYDVGFPLDDVAQRQRLVPGEARDTAEVLARLVDNPEKIMSYARQDGAQIESQAGGFNPTKTPSLSGSPVDYLIVTNEEMAPEFQRLADHKIAQGINTLVVTREFLAANVRNGADIQETIRMFIRDSYERWGTEYVLLGGDTDVIPARIVTNSFYPSPGETDIPVDLYFACLDGNWNADGDAFFGQPASATADGDDVDFAEEVYVGRATVSNAGMAQVFVDKTLTYENAPAGAGWPNRVLYAAEVLFHGGDEDGYQPGDDITLNGAQFAHEMVTTLVEPCTDMEYLRMYESEDSRDVVNAFPRDLPLTRSTLIDSLDTGHYGIVNQIGHGFYFNMSVGDANFMTYDADALVNGDHPFMLFSLNCASCAFDYSCLMERFLQNPNGGSVVSIGSARAAFPNTSNNYQQEFFDHLYCQGETRVGRLVALSRLPFLGSTQYNYVDRWTFENYTLLGDPTLALWTGTPRALDVSASTLQLGNNSVTVQVDSAGAPVEGALVCLQREGEDFATGITDAAGQVVLPYMVTAGGSVQLTVSGQNLALTHEDLVVAGGSSYLALDSFFIMDNGSSGSVGNGNSEIEAGETLALTAVLLETGGSAATGLTGILSCADPRVSFATDTVSFANVAAGGATASGTPYLFSLQSDIPDGTPLTFTLTVTDGAAGTSISEKTILVKAPEIEPVALDWDDGIFGDDDGFIDSGERLTISVRIKNYGSGRVNSLTAYLRSESPYVVLWDTLATFNGLDHLEEGELQGILSMGLVDIIRSGTADLVLVDDYGRTLTHVIDLDKPTAPEIVETDSSLGADVIALRWSPSTSDDVLGYNVFRSTASYGPWVQANPDLIQNVSYYRDEGLDRLTNYFYRIQAVTSSLMPSPPSVTVEQPTAPAENAGYPVSFSDETSSHLAVGDVDGDGDLEIVLVSDEVYVWHHDGSELLDGDNDSQTLGRFTDMKKTLAPSGVALAQIDGEPGLEIVITELDTPSVYVFSKDGSVLPGWPQSVAGVSGTTWIWATPAVGDVDGDGSPEIVANSLNGVTWVWHADGTELLDGDSNAATNGVFKIRSNAIWEWGHSSPALYDLDGDGAKDIIFGSKANDNGSFPCTPGSMTGPTCPASPTWRPAISTTPRPWVTWTATAPWRSASTTGASACTWSRRTGPPIPASPWSSIPGAT